MKKVLVIGDVILDQYNLCRNRHNPESSAPCYTVDKVEFKPGGAGNTAANLAALGASVRLVSVCGADENARIVEQVLSDHHIVCTLIRDATRPTIVKQRVLDVTDGRYHVRLDFESTLPVESNHTEELLNLAREADLVLVSDYAKGVVSKSLLDGLRTNNIPFLVDPKPQNKSFYHGALVITPNLKEAREMTGVDNPEESGLQLVKELDTNVLLTRSEQGMSFFGKDGSRLDVPTEAKEVFDVTGAGDTVFATLGFYLASGYTVENAVRLANKAAGLAVGHVGCYQVKREEIEPTWRDSVASELTHGG